MQNTSTYYMECMQGSFYYLSKINIIQMRDIEQ